eukprot:scaffold131879_cov60-Phaeocystis_antarctica.AAC.6
MKPPMPRPASARDAMRPAASPGATHAVAASASATSTAQPSDARFRPTASLSGPPTRPPGIQARKTAESPETTCSGVRCRLAPHAASLSTPLSEPNGTHACSPKPITKAISAS